MRAENFLSRGGVAMHSKELTIAPSSCDRRGEITLAPLLNHLQDAANEAASKLGASVPQILPLGFTWMLVKYRLKAERMPRSGETLSLRTWHFPHGRLYSLRAFELYSGETRILRAETCWVLVSVERRKPLHIEKALPSLHEEKNPPIPFEFEKVERCEEGPWKSPIGVEESDIDDNGHVNHVRYLDWAVSALPPDWRESRSLRGFDAEFHEECRAGETLEAIAGPAEDAGGGFTRLHRINRPADGTEVFRMKTTWA